MGIKLLAASGELAASGASNRVQKLLLASDGVGNGSCTFKTGGTGGTSTSIPITILNNGDSVVLDLGAFNIVADYCTLVNATAMVTSFGD